MWICAIIPLRAGSKRIPGKNTKLLNWKPFFCYTLDEALESDFIDTIVVTTDDSKVVEILKNQYLDLLTVKKIIILDRDAHLSGDFVPTIDVILDVLDKISAIKSIVLLQATSPFRKTLDIDNSIKLFLNDTAYNIISFKMVEESPYWQWKYSQDKLIPLFDDSFMLTRSQDLPCTYIPNWAIYVISKESLLLNNSFYWWKIKPYIMDEISSIDVDEQKDFEYCSFLLSK